MLRRWNGAQVAEEVFLLSRVVRSFGTEECESSRYRRCLAMLRRISIRQAAAYLLYLVTNATLFNLTKARFPCSHPSVLMLTSQHMASADPPCVCVVACDVTPMGWGFLFRAFL